MTQNSQHSHESYVDQGNIEGPSNRSFGLTVGGMLCAIALIGWYWNGGIMRHTILLLVFGVPLILCALLLPGLLTLPNRLWMKLGLLLARIVNPIMLFVMFAIVFVPVASVMRLLKRDALRRKHEPQAASYWITRDPPGPSANGIVNQF
jgi:cobalamin biosynthesis protein CobD/CbiB